MNIYQFPLTILNFFKAHLGEIIWLFAILFIGKILLRKIVKNIIKFAGDYDKTKSEQQRLKTIGHIIITMGNVVIYVIIFFMVIDIFKVDIVPIITGAGVIALIMGFGSQVLVKDFVSGLLIIIENQYSIGDRIKIGAFEGEVIKITIRSTILRDDEKKIYYISNGSITSVINLSQGKRKNFPHS